MRERKKVTGTEMSEKRRSKQGPGSFAHWAGLVGLVLCLKTFCLGTLLGRWRQRMVETPKLWRFPPVQASFARKMYSFARENVSFEYS
jgi:hypothetical protein